MRIFPIIPIWIMIPISFILIIYIIIKNKSINQILIVILIFIINMRIMIPSDNSEIIKNDLDVLFVIDNTISMNALDYKEGKTRLSGVKEDCKYIIDELNGSRFSVISFDNNTRVLTPFTYDSNITKEAIEIINPIDELYAKGTSIDLPIETIIASLNNSKKKNNNNRIIFFISDGENTNNSDIKSFKKIAKYISNGAVLGYGTKKGAYMINNNKYKTDAYIMDYTSLNYGKAISKIDENNLKKIANDINIDYIHMNSSNDIKSKIKEIKMKTNSSLENNDKAAYEDIYYIFVIPLFILLLIELIEFRRRTIWKNY